MVYQIVYASIEDRVERDNHAIADLLNYVGEEKFELLVALAAGVERGEMPFRHLNMAVSLSGVTGYPFHAFARRHCLAAYRAWMADGEDAVHTDEAGYEVRA